ncbi:ribonuclease H-like domain-containing protein [Tanacetum coccineum]
MDNEDLEPINPKDLEEMDLKWQVAMLTIRVKKFMKKTGRNFKYNGKEIVGFDKTMVECYNCHRRGHFARECRASRNKGNRNGENARRTIPVETSATALIVQDRVGRYDWSFQAEEASINFALMAYSSPSSLSSSDSEVHTCLKECLKYFETLQKHYDEQKEKLNTASLEIIGYQIGLESVEARLLVHENNEAAYEESIEFLKYDVRVRDAKIKQLKNQLDEALKEKDDLKLKLQKFDTSSKNLTKLINSQITVNDKAVLDYDSQVNESQRDVDDNPVNDRFKTVKGYHAVPPPYTRNYLPLRADLSFAGLDDSVYRSDMSKSKANETGVKPNETVVKPIKAKTNKVEPKPVSKSVVNKSRVFNDAPLIEEWDSDSDEDEIVLKSVNEKHTNEKAEQPRKFSQSPRNDKKNWNERMTQKLGLGFGFTKKACFVCGSLNHLIRYCNYHENKMVKKSMMNNVGKASDLRGARPVWNNAKRVNHQNFSNKWTHPHSNRKFVPSVVLTNSGKISINTTKPGAPKPTVNVVNQRSNIFHKSHSPVKRPFHQRTIHKNNVSTKRVSTVKVNVITDGHRAVVSTIQGNKVNVVKSLASCIWRPKPNVIDHVSKDNSGSWICKGFEYFNPQGILKSVMAWVLKRN